MVLAARETVVPDGASGRGLGTSLYPGSLVRRGNAAPGKAGLRSHLYFELQAFISVQGKTATMKCVRPFKGRLSRKEG